MDLARRVGVVTLAVVLSLSAAGSASGGAAGDSGLAPLRVHAEWVPGSYLVVLRESASGSVAGSVLDQAHALGAQVTHTYEHVLDGFAARLSDAAVAELRRNPNVRYLEQDTLFREDRVLVAADQTPPDGAWGLDRIDQRMLPLDNSYSYTSTGQGVNAYVIDAGIRETHQDFQGRAEGAVDLVGDGMGTADCSGHGTPVAGMVGGASYGVAKQVRIKAVRIFSCAGSSPLSRIVDAMDWIVGNGERPAVVNMSLSGPQTASIDEALGRLVGAGYPTVVSAGNNFRDACDFSPRHPDALVIGGSEINAAGQEIKRGQSNFGPCVDVFAPGAGLRGPSADGDTAVSALLNGTSYAAPHVVGIVARHLQNDPDLSAAQALALVVGTATPGQLDPASIGAGSPNLVAYADPATLRLGR